MRQNLIIVLLSVIATLLAVMVFRSPPAIVLGQTASGSASVGSEIGVATGSMLGGSGSALYIYDKTKNKLLAYFLGNGGLELRAVRDLSYDLQAIDFTGTTGKPTPVSAMKKAVYKQAKASAKEAKENAKEEEEPK